jgi:hypothetical protein
LTTEKSPVVDAVSSVNETSPPLVSVTRCAALVVVISCGPNVRDSGVNESVAGFTPVPVNCATWEPTASTTVRIPFRTPAATGANSIETVHPTLDARVGPHVLAEIAKSPDAVIDCNAVEDPPRFEMVMF